MSHTGHADDDPNPTAQRRAEQANREKLARETEDADLRRLMGEQWGRRLVWRWLEVAGAFHEVFIPNFAEANFEKGKRNTAMKLLADVTRLCPDLFLKMLGEGKNDRDRSAADGARNKQRGRSRTNADAAGREAGDSATGD